MCVTLVLFIAVAAAARISLVGKGFLRRTQIQIENLTSQRKTYCDSFKYNLFEISLLQALFPNYY